MLYSQAVNKTCDARCGRLVFVELFVWMQLRAAGASLLFPEIAVAISTAGVAVPVPGRANAVQPDGRFDGARADRAASFAGQLTFRIPLSHRSGRPLLELWDLYP